MRWLIKGDVVASGSSEELWFLVRGVVVAHQKRCGFLSEELWWLIRRDVVSCQGVVVAYKKRCSFVSEEL